MLKNLLKKIFKHQNKSLHTKDIPKTFSYGNFLLNNPNANRIERRKAVKEFLDATRK